MAGTPGKTMPSAIAFALMNPRICVCCGEQMADDANSLSRNPNMCASCSSLSDGMNAEVNEALHAEGPDPDAVPEPRPEVAPAPVVARYAFS